MFLWLSDGKMPDHHSFSFVFVILFRSSCGDFICRSGLKPKWMPSMAWLGLFAMLMIYVAPLVSQSMMSGAGHHSQMSHHHSASPAKPNHQTLSLHHEWCGYCSLLLHISAIEFESLKLTGYRVVLAWVTTTIQPLLFQSGDYRTQLPRAPPVTLV
ncbi:DUF2946 domain-containing protein [Vibrio mangrovi]|uniref:DUF2946 domain-containing protein n=1 Tax=Vibrio mangrovi TaxID=474394 RepID=UPI00190E5E89|nr:DUF2946 domain-containing protein [Vibrio mangrovi]